MEWGISDLQELLSNIPPFEQAPQRAWDVLETVLHVDCSLELAIGDQFAEHRRGLGKSRHLGAHLH